MSFDWSEYLNLAQELTGQSTSSSPGQEARSRAAISRAYYAAFCKSRNHLRDNENKPVPKGPKAHGYVRSELENSSDKVRQGMGKNLDRLGIERNRADYCDEIPNLASKTSFALGLANRIVSDLAKV